MIVRNRKALLGALIPKGSKGEKRPADVIGNAVHVMRLPLAHLIHDADDFGVADVA
jgi:hypothetical protein